MPDSTNSNSESQTSDNSGESRKPAQSQLEQVAALLRDDDDQGGESKDGKQGESHKKGEPPKTLNDVAERLGLEVKDLFGIEFNLGGDGESLTLGKLKDLATDHGQFEVDRLQFEETKTAREAEFLKAQTELAEVIALLPKNAIKPELIQMLANRREQTLTREKGMTLKAIPDWKDTAREGTDRTAMQAHLAEYGYAPGYLETITDHRTLKYIRDNMQRQERITRVLAQVKQIKKPAHKPSGAPTGSPQVGRSRVKVSKVETQAAAVAELLNPA